MTRTALASAFLFAALCHGAGRLEGTIRDSSGAVVPGTSVLCVSKDTGFRFYAQTSREGSYVLTVPDGLYNIIVQRPGFQSDAKFGVVVPREGTLRADFELTPNSVRETITVLDTPEAKKLIATTRPTVLKPEELENLPQNDGTVTGLLALVPGILFTPATRGESGQFSSAGARPNTNFFTVDGVSANNAVAGAGWPSFLPGGRLPEMTALGTTHGLAMLDAVQEVSVDTHGSDTQTNETPGASIVIHTRSGTNHIHGSFFFHVRPQALGASDWFANRYAIGPDAPTLNEEGGSFGGPLHRDRTFFFVSAERLALQQGYAWTTTVPSRLARGLAPPSLLPLLNEFPLPNGPDLSFGISQLIGRTLTPAGLRTVNLRVDHQLSPSTRVFLRLAETPSWTDSGQTQIALTQYRNLVSTLGVTRTAGGWTQESRASYSRNEAASTWSAADASGSFYSQSPSLAADFSSIVVGGAGTVSMGQNGRNFQNQFQATHTAARTIGRHQLRFGFEFLDLKPVRHGPAVSATVAFGTPTNIAYGALAPVWITYSHPEADSTSVTRASAFAEDTWHISARLSVTLGLRVSYPKAPQIQPASGLYLVDESPIAANDVGFTSLLKSRALWTSRPVQSAPRIATAWRLSQHGDAVLRASWSLFQDPGSAAATDQLNGIPYQQVRSATGDFGQLYSDSQLISIPVGYGYARNLRLPTYQRWAVQIQKDWHHRDSVAVSYQGLSGSAELRRQIILNPTGDLGALIFASGLGNSQYHGLNVLYRRSLATGLQASAGYTWSHSVDLNSSDASVFLVSGVPNIQMDRGSSDFDVRHVFNAAVTYTTPRFGRGIAGRWASQWNAGAMIFARSGFPIDILVSETLNGFAVANYRPTALSNAPAWINDPSAPGGRALNPNAFGFPFPGLPPMERNSIRGFGMWQADVMALHPVWKNISLRVDAYNLTNSPRFADPARYVSNPMFGQSQSALNLMLGGGSPSSGQSPAFLMGAPRSLQVSLRLSF